MNNVLDYSSIDAGLMALTPRRFAIHTPVEEALDAVSEPASRKGLALGYVIAPGVPDVIADQGRVRQVLLNLLSNAVKYTDRGQVAIHVDAANERHGMVEVTIRVSDTGIGIREDLQQRLFQWFSRIDPPDRSRVGGTGLGLAISDRLSRLLGGSMTVDSHPGEGSTFTFTFRALAAPAHAMGAADLRDARVLTLLGPGIVTEQLLSLLQSWAVQAVVHDGDGAPAGEIDAVIVDADVSGGALRERLSRHRQSWGLDRVPVITIVRLHPGGDGAAAGHEESFVATPVRKQALHDALAAALRRSPVATERIGASRPAFDGSRLAVLLVEDNESNRQVVALMLDELGLHADQAAGGYEAIDRAARRRYDVILMDVQMPDLDGLEAARRIRADEPDRHATIIALTANVLESDETRCRAAGMDGYLQKPLTLETLSFALRNAASPLHK